jgi:TetR/AcrR family transcriptional regulator, regulator of biofilm formation and stress response
MPASPALSAKGADRRARLLDAAITIIGSRGLAQLSMRALAEEARMPLGAVGYYFDDKQQLIAEAFRRHAERELERVTRTVASIGDAGSAADLARVLAGFVIDGVHPVGTELIAEYEFLLEATRRPELARASTAWLRALHDRLHETVRGLGSPDPATDTGILLAAVAGLEVDHLGQSGITAEQADAITATFARLLGALSREWEPRGLA